MLSSIKKASKLDPASLRRVTDEFAERLLKEADLSPHCGNGHGGNVRRQCNGEAVVLTVNVATALRKTVANPYWGEIDVDVEASSEADFERIKQACKEVAETLGIQLVIWVNHMPSLEDIRKGG